MTYPYAPGLAGVPVAESKVCYIDGTKGILQYRGYPIEALAEKATFEEVAYLLVGGKLPNKKELAGWKHDLAHHRRLKYKLLDLIRCLPESGHPMDALDGSVAALGMFYPGKSVEDPAERHLATVRLIAKFPTIVAAYHRLRHGDEAVRPRDDLDHAANFIYMLDEKEPEPDKARVLDVCLTLHAEHSMNASTFSARVTASTLADPYSVVSSAVGTLTGPLHGGANEEVLVMLEEIGSVKNVRPWVEAQLAGKKKISGFGHRVYKTKDPRAKILQGLVVDLFEKYGRSPLYDVAVELERVMEEKVGAKGVYPNVDFYSGLLYSMLGVPLDLMTPLFAIARVAGWLAHWLEQLDGNKIYRPDDIYMGERDRAGVPVDGRSCCGRARKPSSQVRPGSFSFSFS